MSYIEIALSVFSLVITGFSTVLWQNFKRVEQTAEKTKEELAAYKLHVAMNHPTQEHLSKAIEGFTKATETLFNKLEVIQGEIKDMAENFRDKLDKKQDRGH